MCTSACVEKAFSYSERCEFTITDTEVETEGREAARVSKRETERGKNNLMLCYPCKT